jgi:DNA-binding transcriptional MerR regulator
LSIGALVRAAGIYTETVVYYGRIGLLPSLPAPRATSAATPPPSAAG